MWILDGKTDGPSLLESSKELKKNYRIFPLKITDGITDRLNPSENSKELKKIQDLPLAIYKSPIS